MIEQADAEGFGSCSNEGECEAVCPKEIPISNIARMTREYVRALAGRAGLGRDRRARMAPLPAGSPLREEILTLDRTARGRHGPGGP